MNMNDHFILTSSIPNNTLRLPKVTLVYFCSSKGSLLVGWFSYIYVRYAHHVACAFVEILIFLIFTHLHFGVIFYNINFFYKMLRKKEKKPK